MRPELVNAEYFEKGNGMREPIVIPAAFNPQPSAATTHHDHKDEYNDQDSDIPNGLTSFENFSDEEWFSRNPESQSVPDQGQDALDMVMPRNLTVRAVAELYGPEEKVEVIDVKTQNGEGKKWNMRRWAEYYESVGEKVVRNVISLEVSQSKLGRLIRRPKIVRDLDLQDSVWPIDLQEKGEIPRVQFYCLMSVADCFTDFHIDFGGSSVFYHILRGKKTFLFIPPKEKHLKKYEEWCMSPAQNWTFLANHTNECYRVDLSEGDTMLIPAGWIHAVWTPEDSLVIGGNFLTRLNFSMQLRIAQIERATGVARKFRYPHFQKIQWYAAIRYLEDDPLPKDVRLLLCSGGMFYREHPAHHDFDDWGENSWPGLEHFHARYYSQAELEGLPDLTRYLLRTALIDAGSIKEGISAETRKAVRKSIPKGHGDPLTVVKDFALWCAWKRGNEPIPQWAYPDADPEGDEPESVEKLSAAAAKKLERQAALQAPRRQSARRLSQLNTASPMDAQMPLAQLDGSQESRETEALVSHPSPASLAIDSVFKRKLSEPEANGKLLTFVPTKKRRTMSAAGTGSHRKSACESCRKRRRACKHKDEVFLSMQAAQVSNAADQSPVAEVKLHGEAPVSSGPEILECPKQNPNISEGAMHLENNIGIVDGSTVAATWQQQLLFHAYNKQTVVDASPRSVVNNQAQPLTQPTALPAVNAGGPEPILSNSHSQTQTTPANGLPVSPMNALTPRGRTKACNDCRRSKVRATRVSLLCYKKQADDFI